MVARLQEIDKHRKELDPFVTSLFDAFGFTVFMRSVIPLSDGENIIKKYMERVKPRRAVVIGTNRGVSTARMAQFCEECHTFDIVDSEMTVRVWNHLGLKNITKHVISTNIDKARILNSMDFDFAFLDGDHEKDHELDFNLTKKCGHVLVHEYWDRSPVKAFMDGLKEGGIETESNFAYWEAVSEPRFQAGGVVEPVMEQAIEQASIIEPVKPKRRGRPRKDAQ